MENKFEMVAKTFRGLEDVLRDELLELGAENVEMGTRMVSFEGDNEILYKANLCCRTALRILKPIVKFTAEDADELYDKVRELNWEQFMDDTTTFSIDSTVSGDDFTHSRFVTYRVKDGIVDHFNDIMGKRPSIRVQGADLLFNVHIAGNRVTISLDSSGDPLYKRGYRVAQTEAPINEVLAAGIIMKSGWRGDSDFVDPMCGSGTFLIEAALIAANINPGIYREHFAFEKWNDFDAELFEDIYNDDSAEREFAYKIYGGDIDPDAIAATRKNIKSAKVEEMVKVVCQPFAEWTDNAPEGILVTNPPYGERIKPENIGSLYKSIGSTLKNYFKGWHAWIIGYKDEHFAEIGLKPSVKIPLYNGNLECSLREYVLFDGSYSQFRAEGGSVANMEAKAANGPKKVRHISDDDWEKESRKFNSGKNFKEEKQKNKGRDKKGRGKDMPDTRSRGFSNDDFDSFRERNNSRNDFFDRNERQRKPFERDKKSKDFSKGPFSRDKERKPFERNNRKEDTHNTSFFGKEKQRKPFDRDRRESEGSKNSFNRDKERKPYNPEKKSGINYNPANSKKPSIPETHQTIINPVHFRQRKNRDSSESADQ